MEVMEAPTPNYQEYEKDTKLIKFIKEDFYGKINNESYIIKIGTLKEFLVLKITEKKSIKNNYISYFTFEQLKNISKSMRYFDNINDIVSFLEEKGKKNEIYLKKLNNSIYIELKILSPNGKQDNMLLEIKAQEISDK